MTDFYAKANTKKYRMRKRQLLSLHLSPCSTLKSHLRVSFLHILTIKFEMTIHVGSQKRYFRVYLNKARELLEIVAKGGANRLSQSD